MKREDLNKIFRDTRKARGIKIAEAAEQLGYNSYTTISKFEHGVINYSLNFACDYLKLLGLRIKAFDRSESYLIQSQDDFCMLIKNVMISRGLSIRKLAEVLGMTKSVCEYMINGKRTISIDKFFDCVNSLQFYILIL